MRRLPGLSFPTLIGVVSIGVVTPSAADEHTLAGAAKAGDWDRVAQLIDASADIDLAAPDGTGAIHWAVRSRATDVVRALILAGADLDAPNRYGETPLSIAARDGNDVLLEVLLAAGADPDRAERALPDGQTLAMLAARTGRIDALAALASHAAIDVQAREERNETTALMWAALHDRAEAITYLVSLGADPNLRSRLTDYPHLGNGVLLTPPEEGVTYVGQTPLQRGGWTALMYAARSGGADAVRALADAGADLNALDPLGESALTLAIINGHWPVVEALLEAGADPNVADAAGSTPLYAAVDFHTLPQTYGRPPPKPRVVAGSVRAARRLLEAGANVDAALAGAPLRRQYTAGDGKLRKGATPLMRAAAAADLTMMRLLLEVGANARAATANGHTALLLAAASARGEPGSADHVPVERAIEAVRLALSFGADVNAVDSSGRTAVHLAATTAGAPAMIQFLADNGAAVGSEDERGRTALDLLLDADSPDTDTVAILRRLTGVE